MMHKIEKIAGIDCVFAPIEGVNSTTIEVLVKAGSVYENKDTNGLSHFLEHMFFKGGKKRTTPKEVSMALDTLGASYNAFTSNEYAGYYVKVADTFLDTAMEVLADMLVHAQFPKKEIESEKGVIVQEIKMYEDMPAQLVQDKWSTWYFGDNAYGWSILGPEENVKNFTQDDFRKHKDALYTKDNLVIAVAGSIQNKQHIEERITELFDDLPEESIGEPAKFVNNKPKDNSSYYDKGTQQNHVIIGTDGVTVHNDDRYTLSMLSNILGGTMSSRLFQNIREKQGLCYYIGAGSQVGDKYGTFYIRAGMEKERWEEGFDAIYKEVDKLVKDGISDEEFEQARKNVQGSLAMSLETSNALAKYVAKQALFKDSVQSIDSHLEKYMNVSKDEINALAKDLTKDNLYAYWIE